MTGETAIRRGTAGAVLLVAAIAAVVSFVHIEHLAVAHGQTRLAALLLPLSIDGTVAAASLVMLQAARCGVTTPWLPGSCLPSRWPPRWPRTSATVCRSGCWAR